MFKGYLPHILLGTILGTIMVAGYASVALSASADRNKPQVSWSSNPITITFPSTSGSASKADSLACNSPAAGLMLTANSGTSKVRLAVAPSTVASCGSSLVPLTLTATCLVSAPQCMGTYHGQVQVKQPSTYRTLQDILRVTIVVTG